MNVGKLKKFLKNIPDDASITVTAPIVGYFHINDRQNCPFRHENGNCLAIGGFCLSVPNKDCRIMKEKEKRN